MWDSMANVVECPGQKGEAATRATMTHWPETLVVSCSRRVPATRPAQSACAYVHDVRKTARVRHPFVKAHVVPHQRPRRPGPSSVSHLGAHALRHARCRDPAWLCADNVAARTHCCASERVVRGETSSEHAIQNESVQMHSHTHTTTNRRVHTLTDTRTRTCT